MRPVPPWRLTRYRSQAVSLSRPNWVTASRLNLTWVTSVRGHNWGNGPPMGSRPAEAMDWDIVDEWGAQSFPASDPPANW